MLILTKVYVTTDLTPVTTLSIGDQTIMLAMFDLIYHNFTIH